MRDSFCYLVRVIAVILQTLFPPMFPKNTALAVVCINLISSSYRFLYRLM